MNCSEKSAEHEAYADEKVGGGDDAMMRESGGMTLINLTFEQATIHITLLSI